MVEYQIQPNTRRCAVTGRELRPGERYFTALLEEGETFVRQDYSAEAWQGPPAAAFSFWTGRVPTGAEPSKPRFDDDLLEECFLRLEPQASSPSLPPASVAEESEPAATPEKINFRYVVALLLIRRKRFRFERTLLDGGVEKLEIAHARTGAKHLVVNPQLTDEEMNQVQEEVFRVLGWN
jgi:hypothetical protein